MRKATSAYVYVCPCVHACMRVHKVGNYYVCSWLCAMYYHIARMFGGINGWRIAELKVNGEIKFGESIYFGHKVLLPAKIWLVKVWRITHDSPNLPNFPAAKHSCYTVYYDRYTV